MYACAECGREDDHYGVNRCARCIVTERLTGMLTDPTTGRIHVRLQPLYDELVVARRAQSVITWLQKPPGTAARLLPRMASGQMPISHEAFRSLPADRSHNYLHHLLTATGVLPAHDVPIELMARWLEDKLADLGSDEAALIGRYARWHVLGYLRDAAGRGQLSMGGVYAARSKVNAAIRLALWADARGLTLAALTQGQLEEYLVEHPGAGTALQGFLGWLRRTRTNPHVRIPWPESTTPDVLVSDADRWKQIDQLLHDETIILYARIGGLFALLFAQPLATIITMRADQVTITDDGRVLVAFDTLPIEMPPGLDELLRRHLSRPGAASIASSEHGWLFPGRNPGHHLVREGFRLNLVAHGIRPGRSRHAAMFALAAEVPAPVLAELIGVADKTAAKWAALAARDWRSYLNNRADT